MDPATALAEQYADAANLEARIALHRRYSTSPVRWHAWVRERLGLRPDMRVLEVGCGSGALWRDAAERPRSLLLTDASYGMAEAARAVNPWAHAACCDVTALPFADAAFDLVVANHMLYHVEHLFEALQEIRRVVAPGGRLIAATNGADHMWQLEDAAVRHLGVSPYRPEVSPSAFWLETGGDLLPTFFPDVTRHVHEDSLVVDDPEPLIAYVLSCLSAEERMRIATRIPRMRSALRREMQLQGGVFRVTKACGFFEARVPRRDEVRVRDAARVLVLDEDDRLLLLDAESLDGSRRFWIAPGGGLHEGEDAAAAARRELREEVGVDADPGRPIWTRVHQYRVEGGVVEQRETYFLVRVAHAAVRPKVQDAYVRGFRWWTPHELRASASAFAPRRLARFLPDLLAGEIPATPFDVGP